MRVRLRLICSILRGVKGGEIMRRRRSSSTMRRRRSNIKRKMRNLHDTVSDGDISYSQYKRQKAFINRHPFSKRWG